MSSPAATKDDRTAYIGIDLAFAKHKRLPVSICNWDDNRLIPAPLRRLPFAPPRGSGNAATLSPETVAAFAQETADYLSRACQHLGVRAGCIAIDAPRSPRAFGMRRRAAEAAMDEKGISCFTTPSEADFVEIQRKVRAHLDAGGAESRIPHANQLWMLVGFRLFESLSEVAPCIEVYPQATARSLGTGASHKTATGGVDEQLAAVAHFTGWPAAPASASPLSDIGFGPSHDLLDAYMCAWIASLEPHNRTALGNPPDDVIWVPNVSNPPPKARVDPIAPPLHPVGSKPSHPASAKRLCPGCQSHEFQRWPFGWDAHAAHRCTGLTATDPRERKAEFKRRFGI